MAIDVDGQVEKYADNAPLRALVQFLPAVGGSIDTLLAWRGAEAQRERFDRLITEIRDELESLRNSTPQQINFTGPEATDLFVSASLSATKHRSVVRIKALARIVVRQATESISWDESEEAVRLVDDLAELDILILKQFSQFSAEDIDKEQLYGFSVSKLVPENDGFSDNKDMYNEVRVLEEIILDIPRVLIELSCIRLLNLGLLQDSGAGKLGVQGRTVFLPTALSKWLLGWIERQHVEDV